MYLHTIDKKFDRAVNKKSKHIFKDMPILYTVSIIIKCI